MLHDVNPSVHAPCNTVAISPEELARWQVTAGAAAQWSVLDDRAGGEPGISVDGRGEPAGAYRVGPALDALRGDHILRTAIWVLEPRGGRTASAVDLAFNVEGDNSYLVRLHVRTGVRYLSVSKRTRGRTEVLVDDIVSFDYERWLPLEIRFVAGQIAVTLDGRAAASVGDYDLLRGGALAIGVLGAAARFGTITVERVHASVPAPRPAIATRAAAVPAELRRTIEARGAVANSHYRIELSTAGAEMFIRGADGGWEKVTPDRDLRVQQWLVLHGDGGSRRNLQASLDRHPLRFHGCELLDASSARLSGSVPGLCEIALTYRLGERHPTVDIELTPEVDGRFVVAHQAFVPVPERAVEEVLCGPLQHATMVRGPESVGRDGLFAPLALVQHSGLTVGVWATAAELDFAYETADGDDGQPFGMSLRNRAGDVQPILYAPQYGSHADLRAGGTYRFTAGLYARRAELFEAYRELLRDEYGYTAYRRNVYGTSLTDTVHNLIDLVAADSGADDSVAYQGSPSGWWSRAKGFIDIENDQAVRTTTTSVLLSAYYLTGDESLYEKRALPTIEYHLSRNGYGWTPDEKSTVYGDPTRNAMCSVPFGMPALGPLATMTRGQMPVVAALARSAMDTEDYWLKRSPFSAALSAYRMSREPDLLAEAKRRADEYLDEPGRTNADPHDFAIYYTKAWVELLELYEETGEKRYLDAAYQEAKRFVTEVFVRPVPAGEVTVPQRPVRDDHQIDLKGWWGSAALYRYPRDDMPDETVPAWMVSPTGMSIEAFKTYRYNGFTHNPGWAPSLLRLAAHTGDDLLRDMAHNAIVGRFTNYPGYYYRQLAVSHMKPDFPYSGPFGNTTIYYHHIPAQLGMAIDYLLAEHQTRSRGAIEFPAEFEQTYVWFASRMYGHRPGRFHGYDNAWLWLPKGLVRPDTEQVNWIAAEDGERLFVSLTNATTEMLDVTATLDPDRLRLRSGGRHEVTVIRDGGTPEQHTMVDGVLRCQVSGHGITAAIVHGVGPLDVPVHAAGVPLPEPERTYHLDDEARVRGMLLGRPDGAGYHAYVQTASREPSTLHYSVDGGESFTALDRPAYPYEWTVPVPDRSTPFTYIVRTGTRRTAPVTLNMAAGA